MQELQKKRSSRQWLCSYTVPWHSCPHHAIIGHACGAKEKAARDGRRNSPAQFSIPSSSNVAMQPHVPIEGTGGALRGKGTKSRVNRKRMLCRQTPIAKRRRLSPVIGIPISFLPASLAARFGAHVRNVAAILPNQDLRRGAGST